MRIGIIVAMGKEMRLLTPMMAQHETRVARGIEFHTGNIGSHEVVAMQSGVGKVNAAIGSLTMIHEFAPQLIISTGVAGGANPAVNVMDIVVGTRVAYHDVYCGSDVQRGAVQGMPLYYEAADVVSRMPNADDIHHGLICSGDQFIDSIDEVNRIRGIFPEVLAVDMESSAIAQVCHVCDVPFVSVRVISDSPGASHNNTRQYADFWEAAPTHNFEILKTLIESV